MGTQQSASSARAPFPLSCATAWWYHRTTNTNSEEKSGIIYLGFEKDSYPLCPKARAQNQKTALAGRVCHTKNREGALAIRCSGPTNTTTSVGDRCNIPDAILQLSPSNLPIIVWLFTSVYPKGDNALITEIGVF